jgi:hypothetical protein
VVGTSIGTLAIGLVTLGAAWIRRLRGITARR